MIATHCRDFRATLALAPTPTLGPVSVAVRGRFAGAGPGPLNQPAWAGRDLAAGISRRTASRAAMARASPMPNTLADQSTRW